MDVRYIAWAGYQFDWTPQGATTGAPEVESEEIGEMNIKGRDTATKAHIKGKNTIKKAIRCPSEAKTISS